MTDSIKNMTINYPHHNRRLRETSGDSRHDNTKREVKIGVHKKMIFQPKKRLKIVRHDLDQVVDSQEIGRVTPDT